jgi:GntR family transcriptional regulator
VTNSERRGLERESPVPYYHQIADWVRDQVQRGDVAPLGRVPSEFELADRFSISRTTARKALDRLVQEGVLFRRAGKGTFVTANRIAYGGSTHLSFSAMMTELGHRTTTQVLLARLVPAPSHVALALGFRARSMIVCIRRLRGVDDRPAAIHTTYLPSRFQGILGRDLTGSLHATLRSEGGREEESRDELEAVVASAEEAKLLGIPVGSPLVLVEGVGFSAALEPLRYTEGLYRADMFRFRLGSATVNDTWLTVKSAAGSDVNLG